MKVPSCLSGCELDVSQMLWIGLPLKLSGQLQLVGSPVRPMEKRYVHCSKKGHEHKTGAPLVFTSVTVPRYT